MTVLRARPLTQDAAPTVISGFGRHQAGVAGLPPAERAKIGVLARAIVSSFRSAGPPVRVVSVTGHADADPARGQDFERRISGERAAQVERALVALVANPLLVRSIRWQRVGVGATRRAVLAPRTEAERRRNRRVEVRLDRGHAILGGARGPGVRGPRHGA